MKKVGLYILIISSVIINFFGIWGYPSLPTWRIANMLFVFVGALYFVKIPKSSISIDMIIGVFVFFITLFAQMVYLMLMNRFQSYEIMFFVSIFILMLFAIYFYIFHSQYYTISILAILVGLYINLIYQIFQFIAYFFRRWDLIILLNQKDVAKTSAIFRIVGPFLGPSGFMTESGHVALFAGPILIYLLIANFYGVIKLRFVTIIMLVASICITLSGGAFIQLLYFGIAYFLIYYKRILNIRFFVISISLVAAMFLFLQNEQYSGLIHYKLVTLFDGSSSRLVGARIYFSAFLENIWFGIGPKSSRFVNADPNTLIPTLLADHGLVGVFGFLFLYFVPMLLAFINSKQKLFLIPFLAMSTQLFLAYGTISWALIWLVWVLSLKGLNGISNGGSPTKNFKSEQMQI